MMTMMTAGTWMKVSCPRATSQSTNPKKTITHAAYTATKEKAN